LEDSVQNLTDMTFNSELIDVSFNQDDKHYMSEYNMESTQSLKKQQENIKNIRTSEEFELPDIKRWNSKGQIK